MPVVDHSALGDELYLTRHQELSTLREALRFIQTHA